MESRAWIFQQLKCKAVICCKYFEILEIQQDICKLSLFSKNFIRKKKCLNKEKSYFGVSQCGDTTILESSHGSSHATTLSKGILIQLLASVHCAE